MYVVEHGFENGLTPLQVQRVRAHGTAELALDDRMYRFTFPTLSIDAVQPGLGHQFSPGDALRREQAAMTPHRWDQVVAVDRATIEATRSR